MAQFDDKDAAKPGPRGGWGALRNIEIDIAAVSLFLFIVLSSAQVIARYFLNSPLAWVEEVSVVILIWMTFIGSAWLVRKDQHIRVELLEELGYPRLRTVLYTVYDLCSIAFLILLAIGGYQLIDLMRFDRTPALRIPYSVIVAVVPVACGLMAVYFALRIYKRHSGRVAGDRD